MNIKHLSDNIIVKALAKEEKTKSGIILPETMDKEKSDQGEVVAVGPGKVLNNGNIAIMTVKPGDKVLYKGWPEKVKIDEQEYQVISQMDVLAILE